MYHFITCYYDLNGKLNRNPGGSGGQFLAPFSVWSSSRSAPSGLLFLLLMFRVVWEPSSSKPWSLLTKVPASSSSGGEQVEGEVEEKQETEFWGWELGQEEGCWGSD